MTRSLAPALLGLVVTGGLLSAGAAPAMAEPVAPAPTTTHLAVHADELIATVEDAAGTTPTGRVVFRVDGERLGVARLVADPEAGVAHAVLQRRVRATGAPLDITAAYAGHDRHAGSTESYRRTDPVVEAVVTSTGRPSASGWYRTPTVVTFLCTAGSAYAACPAAVTKNATRATSVVRRTLRADDGGRARVEVTTHRVDPWAPRLAVSRVGEGPYPRTARPVRCTATDTRSGVHGGCRVAYGQVVRTEGGRAVRSWTALATDNAGNRRVRQGSFAIHR
ncbi:hypothetical protein [Nocardioides sp. CFH 31398]|uniref:hypothetical protein n=1 Tax=Nocardioides sp. CFH 31398 TaxID=2919579 RepID=UPI001F06B445|nr:hypothetical protein [Nocardioides sp. CFH 31398]MCH1866159.1 hypothetical protein [Nocardioides sp. CFH 31398]